MSLGSGRRGGLGPLVNVVWRALLLCAVAAGAIAAFKVLTVPSVGVNTRIAVVFKSTDPSIAFWQIVEAGVKAAAKEFEVRVSVVGPKEEKDTAGQIALVERVIRERPQAIVLAADDYNALVPAARSIRRAGIKLVTLDSGLPPGLSSSFIATDNVAAGRKAGELEAQLLSPGSTVAILSYVQGTLTAIDREKGVRDLLGADAVIRVAGTWYCEDLLNEAYSITRRLLTSDRGITGIIALNEVATEGAAEAIADLKEAGRVELVGFDSSPIETTYLEAGVIKGIVLQKPFNMGYLAVKTAVELLRGQPVPARIDTGSAVITRKNMDERENQKLLFPLIGGQ